MKAFVVLLLFVGMALVIHGVYEERYQELKKDVRVEYRFLPRTLYEEQLGREDPALTVKFKSMFQEDSPWSNDYEPSPRPEEGIQEFVQHYAMMEVLTLHANEPDYLDEFVVTFTRGSHVAILDTRPSESYTDYYGVCLGKGFGKRFSSDDHKDHVNILLYLDDEHDIAVTLQRRRLLTFMEKKISWSWETVVRAIGTACAIMDATDCVDRKVVHKDKPLPDIGFVYDYEMSLKEFSEYVLFLPEYMCSNCGCEKVGMGKCSACSFAYFCCEECQIKHSHTHRQVCKGAALTSNVNEDGVFMLGLDEAAMSKIASRSRSLQGLVNYVMQTDEFDPYTKLHDVLSDCTRI